MLTVAIIGLLAAIALPKFANVVIKAKEASVKGKLGTVRSAIGLYYASNEGIYPAMGGSAPSWMVPQYLDEMPLVSIPTVPAHSNARTISINPLSVFDWFGMPYLYYNTTGKTIINCTHTDSNGVQWSLY